MKESINEHLKQRKNHNEAWKKILKVSINGRKDKLRTNLQTPKKKWMTNKIRELMKQIR